MQCSMSPRSRMERCRAELLMLDGDEAQSSQAATQSADGIDLVQFRDQAPVRETALDEVRVRNTHDAHKTAAAGGGLGGMERMRERRHGNRSLEEVGQKLEEAEENNALLEHELLRLHEELSRTRRESMRNDLAQQEEIRALQNRNNELYQEREEAVELLDTSVSKAASLHRRLESLQQTHSAHTAASERRESEKDKASRELAEAMEGNEKELASQRIARLKAEEDNKMLRVQLAQLKAERASQGGQEDAARAATLAQLVAESSAHRLLREEVMSASGGVASDCKAMLRATDDLRCVLEAHAANQHEERERASKEQAAAATITHHLLSSLRLLLSHLTALAGEMRDMSQTSETRQVKRTSSPNKAPPPPSSTAASRQQGGGAEAMEEEGEGREVRELLRQARDIPHVLRHLLDAIRRHTGAARKRLTEEREVLEAVVDRVQEKVAVMERQQKQLEQHPSKDPSDDHSALAAKWLALWVSEQHQIEEARAALALMRAACQPHSELADRESGEGEVKSTAPAPEGPEDRDICMSGAEQARTHAGAAVAPASSSPHDPQPPQCVLFRGASGTLIATNTSALLGRNRKRSRQVDADDAGREAGDDEGDADALAQHVQDDKRNKDKKHAAVMPTPSPASAPAAAMASPRSGGWLTGWLSPAASVKPKVLGGKGCPLPPSSADKK